jgi:hypothetical protein
MHTFPFMVIFVIQYLEKKTSKRNIQGGPKVDIHYNIYYILRAWGSVVVKALR